MDTIKKVLDIYGVYPMTIDKITDRVYRVNDGRFEYALKQSSMRKETIANWEKTYQQAFEQNLSMILPVYITKNGELYAELEDSIYYLTPWIDAEKMKRDKQNIEILFRNLGMVHAKTKKEQMIAADAFIRNFDTYRLFCEDTAANLLSTVEQFEKSRYMSPFELLVCTQYRDLEYALKEIYKRLERLTNQEDEKISWNYSLCHGHLNFSHMLFSNQPYLLNLEKAKIDSAVMDLAALFKSEIRYYDSPSEALIEQFSSYTGENELTDNELQLLAVHLLDPAEYSSIIQDVVNERTDGSTVTDMIRLQHAYRRIIFGLQLSSYIEKEYEMAVFDDLES